MVSEVLREGEERRSGADSVSGPGREGGWAHCMEWRRDSSLSNRAMEHRTSTILAGWSQNDRVGKTALEAAATATAETAA